MKYNNIAVRSI